MNELVTRKATPEEAAAFRTWLLDTAKRTAEAAKEGGFMGFKAEQVEQGAAGDARQARRGARSPR